MNSHKRIVSRNYAKISVNSWFHMVPCNYLLVSRKHRTLVHLHLHVYMPDVQPSTEYPGTVLPVHVLVRLYVPMGDGVGAQRGPVYHTSALSIQRNTFYQPGRANGPT